MAGRKLKANVWVAGDLYEAGSTPSKEIADQISNPKAWDESEKSDKPAAKD